MVDLSKRVGMISKLVAEKPNLGKTAIMKMLFLLQQVYKVPLGYDYEIYTYGPYSSEVMNDIDFASQTGAVSINAVMYPTGYIGYNLKSTDKTDEAISAAGEIVTDNSDALKEVISLFGDKQAKELELSTTIIYLYANYMANNWDASADEITANVHEIKPHFDLGTIHQEYDRLKEKGLLDKAV